VINNNSGQNKLVKRIGYLLVACAITFGVYRYASYESGPIYEFNVERDTKAVLDIFEQNKYWLLANPDSSPAFMIKYRTPNENPIYFGKMRIKVLREDDKLAGFVTYYMENPGEGRILFLAVGHDFRGKGYGTQLAQYAIADLIRMGSEKVTLWTRLANLPAQKIYKGLGFTEVYYTPGGYVFFEYIP
jgi:ribosomal protein S18 acetylase RimI-like enzyme